MCGPTQEERPSGEALTIEAFRKLVPVGRSTAYELVRSGRLRAIRIGRRILIPRGAVEEFLDEAAVRESSPVPGEVVSDG